MTKTEIRAIENVIARLKEQNCGCSLSTHELDNLPFQKEGSRRVEYVSRIYLDSWIIPALELLLPGETRDPDLAASLSSK